MLQINLPRIAVSIYTKNYKLWKDFRTAPVLFIHDYCQINPSSTTNEHEHSLKTKCIHN